MRPQRRGGRGARSPGFPIYESQIEYLGGDAAPYGYVPTDDGFAINLDRVKDLITPDTVAIIYNDLQNPISAESSAAEKEAIAALAVENDLWVLSDEAYFQMRYEGTSSSIATLPGMAARTVTLYTFSKKFVMTGPRLGCVVAPRELATILSTLNTNDVGPSPVTNRGAASAPWCSSTASISAEPTVDCPCSRSCSWWRSGSTTTSS